MQGGGEKNIGRRIGNWEKDGNLLHSLPLPLGEVSERSEDGEGIRCKTLSAACGDSSPGGRAKGKGSLDEALSEGKLRGPSGGVSCEHYGSTIKFRAQPRDPAKRSRG